MSMILSDSTTKALSTKRVLPPSLPSEIQNLHKSKITWTTEGWTTPKYSLYAFTIKVHCWATIWRFLRASFAWCGLVVGWGMNHIRPDLFFSRILGHICCSLVKFWTFGMTKSFGIFLVKTSGTPPPSPPLKKWQNSLLDFYSQPLWTTPVVLC